MRDRLMLGEQTMVELSVNGPEPQGFELSYMVESESELRDLIEGWGGAGVFWRLFDVSNSGGLLSATPATEGGRTARVWVHLQGEDFAPPSPAPLPLVERLRQEGLAAVEEPPRGFGIRRVRDQGGEIVHAERPGVRDAI